MIVYDVYTIDTLICFDIGLGIKYEHSTKQPHRVKGLPLKECIDSPSAEMKIGSDVEDDALQNCFYVHFPPFLQHFGFVEHDHLSETSLKLNM